MHPFQAYITAQKTQNLLSEDPLILRRAFVDAKIEVIGTEQCTKYIDTIKVDAPPPKLILKLPDELQCIYYDFVERFPAMQRKQDIILEEPDLSRSKICFKKAASNRFMSDYTTSLEIDIPWRALQILEEACRKTGAVLDMRENTGIKNLYLKLYAESDWIFDPEMPWDAPWRAKDKENRLLPGSDLN